MGEDVPIAGSITVKVSYNEQEKELDLLVVQGSGPSLLGRDWLKVLRLDWSRLHQITQTPDKWPEVVMQKSSRRSWVESKESRQRSTWTPKPNQDSINPVMCPMH